MYIHAIQFWVHYIMYSIIHISSIHISCWMGEWLYSRLWECFTEYEERYLFTQACMLCKYHCSVVYGCILWFIVQCYYAWKVHHCFLQQAPIYKKRRVGDLDTFHIQFQWKIKETIERGSGWEGYKLNLGLRLFDESPWYIFKATHIKSQY